MLDSAQGVVASLLRTWHSSAWGGHSVLSRSPCPGNLRVAQAAKGGGQSVWAALGTCLSESPRVGALGWRTQGREMPPCGGVWPLHLLGFLSGRPPPRLGSPSPSR